MEQGSCSLDFFRRPSLCRDIIVTIQAALTLLIPCYAGIPDWWITRDVIRPEIVDDNYAALNAGQLKHAVSQAVNEMNENLQGGAGTALNSLVAGWAADRTADNYEMVNAGQLKHVLQLWYDRLNAVHSTSGYPWPQGAAEDYFAAVNVGQLKNMLRLDVRQPWNNNIAEGNPLALTADSLGPVANTGALSNRSGVLGSQHHYLRNPLLGLTARGGNPLAIPANAENIPSAPAATSAGEFKVGQDGSANYTIRLQGPKGVANVEPAISLDYNSNGGDGIVGLGWNLSGLSVINRGPTSIAVDGYYDPADFDANDRFYLDGERLICVAGTYGEDGSEYRTLKEQFSKVIYHKAENEDWFEVKTKAGLTMEFGHCNTSCIGPKENGNWCAHPKTTWAVCKVSDSLGNYWSVQYADLSPGQDAAEDTPYLPDYQPSVIRYTGHSDGRAPAHEIRFYYENRPDQHRGYLMGFLVRKTQRLRGVEVLTDSIAIRSWRLKYNIGTQSISAMPAVRSCLQFIQEVSGAFSDPNAQALPSSVFHWEEAQRGWSGDLEGEVAQRVIHPGEIEPGESPPYEETEFLELEHPVGSISYWMPKPAQYVDLDGDGLNEILFNHRGPLLEVQNDVMMIFEYRHFLEPSNSHTDRWEAITLPGVESGYSRRYHQYANPVTGGYYNPQGATFSDIPLRRTDFPYLTTATNVPTGANLVDINMDGLPDIISSGTFDYVALKWENGALENKGTGDVINASGIWLNQGGTFVKDIDGISDTVVRKDVYANAALLLRDNWGDWRFPRVPCEFTAGDGGNLATRPGGAITIERTLHYLRALGILQDNNPSSPQSSFTIPEEFFSGSHEVLGYPQFALFKEHDLGWRFVDMDGDGDMDIIRGGQGLEASGWLPNASSSAGTPPTILGTGAVSSQGRQLCFGLRNNGPDSAPGERWTLINPSETHVDGTPNSEHLKSIWKLPLPLVDDNGKVDMGRRLLDLNGDGLPDFLAQKKRQNDDTQAPWTQSYLNDFDIEVWINGGTEGWIDGGDAWRIEGIMISWLTSTGAMDIDYGRMFQDMNGDGLPDFVVSSHVVGDGVNQLHQGVFLNNGKGWVKKLDSATGRHLLVNHTSLIPPKPLFFNRVPRPYSLIDMNGDGRPEFLNGRDADGVALPGGSKVGLTYFMNAFGGWIPSPQLTPNQDWNLADELLAGSSVPLNFTELNGDGIIDILRTKREGAVSKTYFRPSLFKPARITRIVNGLGVLMDLTYGNLPQLAGNTPDHHYQPGPTPTDPEVSATIPPAAVVTHYTTRDGTENAQGNGGGTITTSYYYAGLRTHAVHGSLGFARMETRSTFSPVRQVTFFSQDWTTDTVGMPLGGHTYHIFNSQPVLLSESATTYSSMALSQSVEVPSRFSRLTYAHTVVNENWSPEGAYMGKTTSVSAYGTIGAELGMLTSQLVTLDQGTAADFTDDTSSSTVHEYFPPSTSGADWRIGQIKKTIVTSNAPGTPSVQKASEFEYYPSGDPAAGMLKTETIDPGTDYAVTKEHIYDANGNEVKTLTTAAGMPKLISETWYSADGRFPVAAVNALGHATVTTYDSVRSVATSATMAFQGPVPSTGTGHSSTAPTPPGGTLSTSTVYDAWGTAKVTTAADGLRSVRYAMYFVDDALPRALYYVYEQAEGSSPVITYFDRYHRALLVEKTGFGGETILQEKQYDHKGRPVRVSKPYIAGAEIPAYTVETYDDYDRKIKVTAPDGSFVDIAYNGFEAITTNHRGQTHKRLADMSERVVKSTDTDGNYVTFAYTADGQPRSSTTTYSAGENPSASTTITTTYNAQRLKESVTDPNTGTSTTYYDAYGRTTATRDSMGHYTVFEYDLLGRTTRRWTAVTGYDPLNPTTPTENYETRTVTVYDTAPGLGLGKPHEITFTHKDSGTERVVTESYVYDALGRPTGSSITLSGQVAFNGSYSSATTYHPSAAPGYGRTATVTDPGGFTRASVYNDLGFLSEVREGTATGTLLWMGKAYDAEGRPLIEEHGNGLGTRNRYHPTRGFVESSLTYRTASNQQVQNLELRVNDLGNVEWRRLTRYENALGQAMHEVKTESFAFDSQNRLTRSYVIGQEQQNSSFFANGNIQSKTGVGIYSYGDGAGPHAVTGVTLGSSTRRYTYDAKGRMQNEYLQGAGVANSDLLLREIAYTSFDQPRFIQHWRSAPLSSDLGELGSAEAAWNQVCTIRFYFGAGLQRLIQEKIKGALVTRSLSLGGYEVRETRRGMGENDPLVEQEIRSHFGNGAKVLRTTATNPVTPIIAYEYSVSDHLGSDSVTYDGAGQVQNQRGHLKEGEVQKTERQSYDAWGARRDGETWAPAKGQVGQAVPSQPSEEREGSNLARGYTGHEMLDDVGLVHMNGRLYDPALGRMCAADPYVQTPENLQNYNRYSYVLNNPLSQIDPSGHFIVGLIAAVVGAIIGIVGAVIATVVAFVAYLAALAAQFVLTVIGANSAAAAMGAMGASLKAAAIAGVKMVTGFVTGSAFGGGLIGKMIGGAALGAIYSGGQTAINGGSFSDVLKSAAIGAATGAVGALVGGVLAGIPGNVTGALTPSGGTASTAAVVAGKVVHSAAHGVAGGLMSMAMGGTFQDGFIGSAIGAGMSHLTGAMFPGLDDLEGPVGVLARTAVATVSGGAASVLAGGKFADGAFSAAFFHVFNRELHEPELSISLAEDPARDLWELEKMDPSTIVLVDRADKRGGEGFWDSAERYGMRVDISRNDWRTEYVNAVNKLGGSVNRVMISDHSASWNYGGQMFGNHPMKPEELKFIAQHVKSTMVLTGCATGAYSKQFSSLKNMSRTIPGIKLVGYSSFVTSYGKNKYGIPLGDSTRPPEKGTYKGGFPVGPQQGAQWTLITR